MVTISRLDRLLITLVHHVRCSLEIMWPRNIQNGFWILFCEIWTRHLRRREQSLYQLGHTTLWLRMYKHFCGKIIPSDFNAKITFWWNDSALNYYISHFWFSFYEAKCEKKNNFNSNFTKNFMKNVLFLVVMVYFVSKINFNGSMSLSCKI